MPKSRHIQSKLLEETMILHILTNAPNLKCYGVYKVIKTKGLDIGYTTLYYLMVSMAEEELIIHGNGFVVSDRGRRKLLSNRCLLRQLAP